MKFGYTIEDSRSKYPELTDELLDDLRKWVEEKGLPEIPKEQLSLFSHSCYFDKEATTRCILNHCEIRKSTPEFFADRDPLMDYLQFSLKALQFAVLPVPDPDGNQIIFHRLADFRPSQYMFNDGIKLLGMTLEASLYTEGCSPGYVFLFDMRGVRLGHLTRLSISSIRKFFEYLQEALPVRLKGIHVLNAVWFIDKILSLIKPFMKSELFDMLHLYSGDVSEVYEYLPPRCLPKDFGGELDSAEELHETSTSKLVELRDYFIEEEKLFRAGCSETKSS